MLVRHGADAANADSRSARRSSAFSIPTDRRTRPGGTASGESATEAWVIGAGSSMSDSTPPSDSASVKSRVAAANRRARSSPSAQLDAEHPARQPHLAPDERGRGMIRQPGVVHAFDLGALAEPQSQHEGVGR